MFTTDVCSRCGDATGTNRRNNGHGSGSRTPHGHGDGVDGSGHPGRDYDRSPLIVTWEATRACSLACDHCRADAVSERASDELDAAAVRNLIDGVAQFDPSPVFVVSGGDPLERPDLFDTPQTYRVDKSVSPASAAEEVSSESSVARDTTGR